MTIECEICGRGPEKDNVTVYRQNAFGEPGIWRCAEHNDVDVDAEVQEVVNVLEADNKEKQS